MSKKKKKGRVMYSRTFTTSSNDKIPRKARRLIKRAVILEKRTVTANTAYKNNIRMKYDASLASKISNVETKLRKMPRLTRLA